MLRWRQSNRRVRIQFPDPLGQQGHTVTVNNPGTNIWHPGIPEAREAIHHDRSPWISGRYDSGIGHSERADIGAFVGVHLFEGKVAADEEGDDGIAAAVMTHRAIAVQPRAGAVGDGAAGVLRINQSQLAAACFPRNVGDDTQFLQQLQLVMAAIGR